MNFVGYGYKKESPAGTSEWEEGMQVGSPRFGEDI